MDPIKERVGVTDNNSPTEKKKKQNKTKEVERKEEIEKLIRHLFFFLFF